MLFKKTSPARPARASPGRRNHHRRHRAYEFSNLAPGEYTVASSPSPGMRITARPRQAPQRWTPGSECGPGCRIPGHLLRLDHEEARHSAGGHRRSRQEADMTLHAVPPCTSRCKHRASRWLIARAVEADGLRRAGRRVSGGFRRMESDHRVSRRGAGQYELTQGDPRGLPNWTRPRASSGPTLVQQRDHHGTCAPPGTFPANAMICLCGRQGTPHECHPGRSMRGASTFSRSSGRWKSRSEHGMPNSAPSRAATTSTATTRAA